MTTYVKSITFGATMGGLRVAPDKVDTVVNEALKAIQDGGGKILDIKIALVQMTPGSNSSMYLVVYDASQPAS